jgi:TRAP-type C4-dicarboxylate transport system permease small subunit
LEAVIAVMICLLSIMVFLQVLFRYALNLPLGWSEEFVMFLFQWCAFLGAALAVKYGQHFHLDLLTRHFPESGKKLASWLAGLCVFLTGYVMVHTGLQMMQMNYSQTYPILGFSVAYGYLAIPVSGAFILLYQIKQVLTQLKAFSRG